MATHHSFHRITRSVLCPTLILFLTCGIGLSQTTSEIVLPLSKPTKSNSPNKANQKRPIGVDFCLYQNKHVKGVTHPQGLQLTELGALQYVLLKPTFTLTEKHVKKCELKKTPQPSVSDLDYRTLKIEFSDLGRAEMFKAFKDIQPASFVVTVNGRAFPLRILFNAKSVKDTSESLSLGYFVDHEFGQSFVEALNPTAGSSQHETVKRLYFPTVAGTKRVVRTTLADGKKIETTETISKVETQDDKYVVTLSRENFGGRLIEDHYEVSSKGLFERANAKDAQSKPLLKLPARVAKMWSHEEFDSQRTTHFTSWGREVVEVPAGTFETIAVHSQSIVTRDGEPITKGTSITWYAIGVGAVKSVSESNGEKRVTELKEFTRGKSQ